MKIFLSQILKFCGLLLALNLILLVLIRAFYIRDYEEVELEFREFLLADSHGTPLGDFMEEHDVYNFSGQSDSYFDMERKLKYLVAHTDVTKVYISVDDHTLSPFRERQNNLDRSAYFTSKFDFGNYVEYVDNRYLRYYIVFLNDRYGLVIRNFILYELLDVSKWFGNQKTPWENLSTREQARKSADRIRDYFPYEGRSETLSASLLNIIDICRENKIELAGIRFPLSMAYHKILGKTSYHADSVFYRFGLQVYDYDSLFIEHDSLFRDQDHLDREGGEKFTDILFDSMDQTDINLK